MTKFRCWLATVAVGFALTAASIAPGFTAEAFNVRFSYKYKGEYGLFLLGQSKGLYKDAGLDVKFGEGAGSQAALGALIQGQEDVVILPAIFAISAIQKGMPVKIVALYQPAAPSVILSHASNPINVPKDLEGKSIAAPVGETGTTYLGIFCEKNNVDCSKVKKVQIDIQARVAQFLGNRIDAIAAYKTNDLPIIETKADAKLVVLDQVKYGLIVPGLAVVTSDSKIAQRKDALKAFLKATSTAVEATRKDPVAATAALKSAWSSAPSDAIVQKQIEENSDSIPPATDKPLGWTRSESIEDALKLLESTENIGTRKSSSAFYTNDLL
ncbi:MAG: ABC transporter substrate-binding protein [Rhizobiales bacterium]|nr:ABC transporter substrate-binding protein [Hyphomicrobiales bacterium]